MTEKFALWAGVFLLSLAGCESHNSVEHEHAKSVGQIETIEKIEIAAPKGADARPLTAYRRAAQNAEWRIIIIPGAPSDVEYWGGAMSMIDDRVDVVAIERPGYHKSGPDRAVTVLSEQAALIAPLIRDFKGRVVLVGHSFGASVALAALDEYGAAIDGVVLVSPYVYPAEGKKARWFNVVRSTPLRFIGGTYTHRFFREVSAQRGQSDALLAIAKQSCAPVLIVQGDLDDLVPIADAERLSQAFPTCADAEFEVIEGADHYMSVHAAGRLTALINGFLKRLAEQAAPR